jgi:hypothetical protein
MKIEGKNPDQPSPEMDGQATEKSTFEGENEMNLYKKPYKRISVYNNMKCLENPPKEKLKLLNKLSYDDYAGLTPLKTKKYSPKEKKTHFNKIKDYIKRHLDNDGVEYEYDFAEDKKQNDLEGRMTNSKSIQQLDGNICAYLFRDCGMDIDIKNCALVTIRYICELNGISLVNFPKYNDYIENRDKWLLEIPNCKDTIIAMLFNDKTKYYKNDDLKALKAEIRQLQGIICNLEVYGDYLEKACIEKEGNKLGCCLCAIYHKVENEILHYIIELFKEKDIKCLVPKFDGAIFENKAVDLNEIQEKVKDKYNVEVIQKPMETTITDTFLMGCKGDQLTIKEVALMILETNKDYFQYHNDELIAYNIKTGMWEENKQKVKSIIYSVCPIEPNPTKVDELYKMLLYEVMNDDEKEGWYYKQENSSLMKLLFKDGYMYIEDKQMKAENKFNPNIMFRNRLLFDLPSSQNGYDWEYANEIKQKFFYSTLGEEIGSYFIELLARGLFGEVMKKIVFCLGNTNTGKSTLVKAFQESFGDLIGSFNGETLTKVNTSQEEAQIMRPFYLVKNKRLIFSNELKMSANLEGNAIKKISSGGDTLTGRLHGGNETPFVPHFLTILCANDIAEINNYDDALEGRINIVHYTKPFKKVVEDPENELQADENIEKEMKTDEFKWNFIGIFILAYDEYLKNGEKAVPNSMIESRKVWINKHASMITLFQETYEFTNELTDYISVSEIKEWIKNNKVGISDNKVSIELGQYAKKKKFDNVFSKPKKIDGKAVRCWFGIKLIE